MIAAANLFPQTLASSNIDFFPQTCATSPPDMDFFTMADHALANAYDTTNVGDVVNHHSDAVLDNFLDHSTTFKPNIVMLKGG